MCCEKIIEHFKELCIQSLRGRVDYTVESNGVSLNLYEAHNIHGGHRELNINTNGKRGYSISFDLEPTFAQINDVIIMLDESGVLEDIIFQMEEDLLINI